MMKCPFCKSSMFPHTTVGLTSETYEDEPWICWQHPNPVVYGSGFFSGEDFDLFILSIYRDDCYKFYISSKETILYKLIEYRSNGGCNITHQEICVLKDDFFVTPENAHEKLSTLLVFS